jgi:hypothetical protein
MACFGMLAGRTPCCPCSDIAKHRLHKELAIQHLSQRLTLNSRPQLNQRTKSFTTGTGLQLLRPLLDSLQQKPLCIVSCLPILRQQRLQQDPRLRYIFTINCSTREKQAID